VTAVGNGCPPVIRPAVAADVPEIAALCLHSWRQTYRGLLADDFLDGLVPEDLAVHWRKYIGSAENGLFVLQEQGAVRGFAACGIDRQLSAALVITIPFFRMAVLLWFCCGSAGKRR
jgi:ribosomal protein S18 acetylase RimI-like enzyme